MQDVCEQIPLEFGDNDGYLRGCYQRLTINISCLKVTSMPRKKQKERMPKRGSIEGKTKLSFNQIAYFANVMVELGSKNKMYGHHKV